MDKKIKFSLAIPVAPYRDCEILESIKKQDYPNTHYEILIQAGPNASENRTICIKKATKKNALAKNSPSNNRKKRTSNKH